MHTQDLTSAASAIPDTSKANLYVITTQLRERHVTENLLCTTYGSDVRILMNTLAGSVARYRGEEVGFLITEEQVETWKNLGATEHRLEFFLHDMGKRHPNGDARVVFTALVKRRDDEDATRVYVAMSRDLLHAMSSLWETPEMALGMPGARRLTA